MRLFLITIIFFNSILFSNESIKNIIKNIYKEAFPSIEIESITLKKFSNKDINEIKIIDKRLINPKKVFGTVVVNKNIYLKYEISAFIYVVKTTKTLKRNEQINISNAKVIKMKLKNLVSFPINPNLIGELSIKNYTPKNKIIYDYNVRKEILVKRGSIIKVISKSNDIEVLCKGKALIEGGMGETINIEINKIKRTGKVIGRQLVEME
jgi:flagella basal body P-ring formation protein FlgA